jgi:hypothetical protein
MIKVNRGSSDINEGLHAFVIQLELFLVENLMGERNDVI